MNHDGHRSSTPSAGEALRIVNEVVALPMRILEAGLQTLTRASGDLGRVGAATEMERENLGVVKKLYDHLLKGDLPGVLALLSPDVDWKAYLPPQIPWSGHYHGPEGVKEFFGKTLQAVELADVSLVQWIVGGEDVVVRGVDRNIRVRATGLEFTTEFAHVFTVRGGKVAKARLYYNTAPMVAAFMGGGSCSVTP